MIDRSEITGRGAFSPRLFRPAALLLGSVLMAGQAVPAMQTAPSPKAAPARPRVVIVSWDGAKPSILRALVNGGKLPALKALRDQGAWTWEAQTVVPSLTLPSHVSMLTGVPVALHGVSWNSYRPGAGPVKVPTVFDVAHGAGLVTAMVYGKEKFRHLERPGTLDASEYVKGSAGEVADAALRVIKSGNPDLLFVHFRAPDDAGHDWGWGNERAGVPPSPPYLEAIEQCDAALARLVESLEKDGRWSRTLFILTADHGGHDKTHGSADPEDMTIPWFAAGGMVAVRGPLSLQVHTEDTAATAVAALGLAIPRGWTGKVAPIFESPLKKAA